MNKTDLRLQLFEVIEAELARAGGLLSAPRREQITRLLDRMSPGGAHNDAPAAGAERDRGGAGSESPPILRDPATWAHRVECA